MSDLSNDYALAIMNSLLAPSQSVSNQFAAQASQIGASLPKATKEYIQKCMQQQALLYQAFGGKG